MDLTALSSAAQALNQAALAISATAQAAAATAPAVPAVQAGLSPVAMITAAAPIIAHSVPALLAKLPANLQGIIQDAGVAASVTGGCMAKGMPFEAALGYGIATAGAARFYHFLALHPSGPWAVLGGMVQGAKDQAASK